LQKDIDLLNVQEDLAIPDDDCMILDPPPSSFLTSSNSSSSFSSVSSLDESQILSNKLTGSGITQKFAEGRANFYDNDLKKAKASTVPHKEAGMAAPRVKIIKHLDSAAAEASVIADCIKRSDPLSAPTTTPATSADNSSFLPIGHKPVFDGYSG
jgi:hypothetical protein